ncbi:MAG: GDSL-type esterase/lipase family protein [Solirubrobacteraceae bacterium]
MTPNEPQHREDNEMDRFDRAGLRRFSARDGVIALAIGVGILILAAGASIEKAGNEMRTGVGRDAVLAVGRPSAWIADRLPVQHAAHFLTAWIEPNPNINGPGGFTADTDIGAGESIPPVTPDAFNPSSIGVPAPARRRLRTMLVTGDSMSEPLDQDLAQTLAPDGVKVIQDPHIGTGISNTVLVNWGQLAGYQVRHYDPDAVVVFIGANDGYSMAGPGGRQVNCCNAEWAAIYAQRAREMMNTYRREGAARVYWLTLPTPRDPARAQISLVVNAAIEVAAEPWLDQLRVIDTVPVFTPDNHYRDSMTINGEPTIVRESDGIHLNDAGSALAAKLVLNYVDKDFTR